MDAMQQPTLFKYNNCRYLKALGWLLVIAVAAYVADESGGTGAFGGSWLGYALGIVSALIVLVLMWFGIAKRRFPKSLDRRCGQANGAHKYNAEDARRGCAAHPGTERRKRHAKNSWRYGGTLLGWLSAHVYLGMALLVLATLHSGFQFNWNVHTLSYVLMLLVVASGLYGVHAYLNYPRQITQNMAGDTLDTLMRKIAELDELARTRALELPDEINALVLKARQETRLGGNLFQQLAGSQADCPTALAVQQIHGLCRKYINGDQPKLMRDLYSVLLQKEKLVSRARNEIMLKARLEGWLYLHVPLSVALLAALTVHIVSVFFYW